MFGNQPKRGRAITCVGKGDRGCRQRAGRGGAPRSESNRSVALNVDASECDRTPVSTILRKRGSGLLATVWQ